ncbi:hypothetical protein C7999DRAFT_33714 [Corynascus novoguineensis]|uniref:Uncharacterized protein n=1 Tax=Corynascus novoguineensis TaxID=1126955 RepID=A0AAN7CQB5_9PEZI|nr:hypothetical protein C7999DRAFT_33714 [Corynascus novoguineensis]
MTGGVNSRYKGKRQHSLASRLNAVVKFVVEKNVYRYLNWETKFSEAMSYSERLALEDVSYQLQGAPRRRRQF